MEGLVLFKDYGMLSPGHFPGTGTFFCQCREGELAFSYLGADIRLAAGGVLILKNPASAVSSFRPSGDFSMTGLFVANSIIPRLGIGKYATNARRKADVFLHPVIRMSAERAAEVRRSFDDLHRRVLATGAFHYEEAVSMAVSRLVLDISEGQLESWLDQKPADANADIFYRFVQLLERGDYKEHRDVAWYAGQLCVSPKHLSFCASAAGGRSAQYWIDTLCIGGLVRDLQQHPAREVCAEYHFSSLSYLSRYVKRLIGVSPRELREM